jgi:hypothetical protein
MIAKASAFYCLFEFCALCEKGLANRAGDLVGVSVFRLAAISTGSDRRGLVSAFCITSLGDLSGSSDENPLKKTTFYPKYQINGRRRSISDILGYLSHTIPHFLSFISIAVIESPELKSLML